jgi:hypothetical protein
MNIGDVSISANFRNLEEREFRELALSFEQRISIVSPEIIGRMRKSNIPLRKVPLRAE